VRLQLLPVMLLLTAQCAGQEAPDFDRLMLTGRLQAAELLARAQGDSGRVRLGDVLVRMGRLVEAESVYTAVVQSKGVGTRPALAGLVELAMRRGDHDAAIEIARSIAADWRARREAWSWADHLAAGRALRLLGRLEPSAVREALAAFDSATAADPRRVEGELGAADLFLERYNAPDAQVGYRAVLEVSPEDPRALVGLARVAAFNHSGDAVELLDRALSVDASYVPALVLRAQMLLEEEHYGAADSVIEIALAVDSTSQDAWAAAASLAWIRGDNAAFSRAESRVKALNSRPADFYAAVAEAAGRHRRYGEAVEIARRGLALDPNSATVLGALGTNLLRTGQMAEGREMLERAFQLDPYHLWHKNSLDLLDELDEFSTTTIGRFTIVAPERIATVLVSVLVPLLEEAYDSLASRYDHRPPTPIRIELYDRHADFSVRTVGLAGLGALGVSFGTLLVMDAPEARPAGEFNFGSTAWHELAHTFTLGASDHRVPRWVSEGLSVLEERRARPGWGARVSVPFLQALAGGELLPVSQLNDGFVRPDRPDRIGLSYYQASLLMEFLEQRHGISGIRQMLSAFATGSDAESALRSLTGVSSDSLDRLFTRWLTERHATALAAMKDGDAAVIGASMRAASRSIESADTAAAIRALRSARDRFPEFTSSEGPRFQLARLLWATGARDSALAEIAAVTAGDETAVEANRVQAQWLLAAGDTAGAIAAFERVTWIDLNDQDAWRKRAELAMAIGRHADAVVARRVIVAMRPSDILAARADLAEALLRSGDHAAARRELLSVLELAPSFERAQELLLEARRP
jgi:tetratricopeptide (TPR) repeat protein